ncbi:hypothetical protein EKPJFOCH_3453 [Methylobacterium thuringiense]|uniref:Cyclic nucleotide-binding domain-containing protein n=2 Tax=Methylobacterium thuringiense TaxID=1003091 RepID=A0ABQ4TQP6_9HYPH|nr:hypothetical protein EKPJFOCH_3453 [Methylobacterium thuringiense]
MESVPLDLQKLIIEPHKPIEHVYFVETGIISMLADAGEGRVEVGMIGREGLAGLPALLGAVQSPFAYLVQGAGTAQRIRTDALHRVIQERPSLIRLFSLYAAAMMAQIAQTTYANANFTLESRLARWILMVQDRTDGDELLITHEFLSLMLSVRRPGVTSATHVLEGIGAISAKRGRIIVRDREKLQDLADGAYEVAEHEYERLMALV